MSSGEFAPMCFVTTGMRGGGLLKGGSDSLGFYALISVVTFSVTLDFANQVPRAHERVRPFGLFAYLQGLGGC